MTKTFTFSALACAGALIFSGVANAAPSTFLGDVQLGGYNFCPRGSLAADGQLLPIAQNTALFSLIGTTYGGDGRTTFALPDMRGRVVVQHGSYNNVTPKVNPGTKYGSETVSLSQSNLPQHTHDLTYGSAPGATSSSNPVGHALPNTTGTGYKAYSTEILNPTKRMGQSAVVSTGDLLPINIMAPSITLTWCITTVGDYPSRP